MKRLLFVIALLLLAAPLLASDVTLAWDNPSGQAWEKVRIYEVVSGAYTLKAEVPGTATTATIANVQPGSHSYVARSFMAGMESANSNTATGSIKPDAPGGLRITVTVDVNVNTN